MRVETRELERRDARPPEQPRSPAHQTTAPTASVAALPMRVAVISDIHANLPALEAVLADIGAEAPDELWCLGDIVGYGPQPNDAVELVRERSATSCLCGNHDLAVLGTLDDRRVQRRRGARRRAGRAGVLGERSGGLARGPVRLRATRRRRALPRQPASTRSGTTC